MTAPILTDEELFERAEKLFRSDGWLVIVHVMDQIDQAAIHTLRDNPKTEFAANTLAAFEMLRKALRSLACAVEDEANPPPDADTEESDEYGFEGDDDVSEPAPPREYKDPFDA